VIRHAILVTFGMVALLALSLTPAGPIAAQSTNETECIDTNDQFSPDVVIGACTALLDSGQLSTADQARVLTSRGNGYFRKGDLDRALVDYNQAIALNPWAPEAFYDRGLIYDYRRDFDRAIDDYDEAIRVKPNFVPADVNLGNIYRARQLLDLAIFYYTVALSEDPHYVKAFLNRGIAYIDKRDYDRAITDFNEALRLKPDYADALYQRGIAYDDKGDFDRAIADFNEALRLGPDDRELHRELVEGSAAAAYYGRGLARLRRGDIDGAIVDDTASIKLVSTNAYVLSARGSAYDMKGAHDLAIADYTSAINLVPTDATLYIARGAARFDTAQYRAATADFALAMQMWPTNIEGALWLYIARTRAGAGNPGAAITSIYAQHQAPKASSRWPYAVVELFLGSRTAAATLAAAKTPYERCEAGFFVGEWDLMHGKRDQATRLLQSAARTCEAISIESGGAKSELMRLGAG
jgi:tetratricopeptide (TPR) repeat protein